ncbi:MAG: hypothetical protein ABWK01_06180 [Infirmifilum sp.]
MSKTYLDELSARNPSASQLLFASFLAALRELGLINFAVVNEAARLAGERLIRIYGGSGSKKDLVSRAAELMQLGVFEVEDDGEKIVFKMRSDTCRVCPKAVGGLELPVKLCPLPGLLGGYSGARPLLERVRREGGYCVIEFI